MKALSHPVFLLIISILFFASCGQLKEPEFKSIENIRVSKVGRKESTITLDLYYFNPNKTQLKLKSAAGDAWIENNFLGHFTIDTLIHIPSNGDFRLPVKLQVDMSKIIQNSLMSFLAKETTVKIEGTARVGKGLIYITYPLRYKGSQNLVEMMK